jgi:lipoic acid synthetase
MLTLGQYLAPGRPGERFLPVDRFVPPAQFEMWAAAAREIGFRAVAAGPLVRSSYRAGLLLEEARKSKVGRTIRSVDFPKRTDRIVRPAD